MKGYLAAGSRFLAIELDLAPRALLAGAAALVGLALLLPLWQLTMFAPQYPDGLRLDIHTHRLAGGNGGQDIKEINVLNHYIGMAELSNESFTEFKWMPLALGALALLFLRSAVHGRMAHLVDALVLFGYFGAFSLWSFGHKLYVYGHDLAPTAAVKVAPFTPPMLGYSKIANFEVYSYPGAGSYALVAATVALVLATAIAARRNAARGGRRA